MKFRRIISFILASVLSLSVFAFAGCENDNVDEISTEEPTAEIEDVVIDDSKAKVILLAGQSNMAGATLISEMKSTMGEDSRKYTKGFENVRMIFSSGVFTEPESTWNDSDGKLKKVKAGQGAAVSQFGPEVGMAEYFSEKYPDETIYIVKHALGGCPIDYYLEESNPEVNSFQHLRDLFDLAVAEIKAETGKDVEVIAVCWSQGETESGTLASAEGYAEKLTKVIEAFRTEYADYAPQGGISFIDNGISDSSFWAFHEELNNSKKQVADSHPHNYYFPTIDAGYSLGADNAHYDSLSEIKLGRQFAEIICEIIDNG